MNLFLAVVFSCVSGVCGFVYNSTPYPRYIECFKALTNEMDSLQRRYPHGLYNGVCLEIEFKGT